MIRNWKCFGRNCIGLIEVLFWHVPERTKENHEKSQSAWPLSRPRFEPSNSGIQVENVTSRITNSQLGKIIIYTKTNIGVK
jgi:hypothetical protein